MSFIRPRWRKPALTILAGAVFAAAWVIRGGPHWWLWTSLTVIAVAGRAFAFYTWGGADDDVGALAGARADERQKLISLRSRALACNVTAVAAFVGLILPSGIWLGRAAALDSRPRASQWRRQLVIWIACPLRHLDAAMGDDMQLWCDARVRAAARQPQWLSDAALYYYSQVGRRVKDDRARDELKGWRESIAHKVTLVRLINLDTTEFLLRRALQTHPSTQHLPDIGGYSEEDLERLGLRLETEALNELHLYLAYVYRLGYHNLLIYPARPSGVRRPRVQRAEPTAPEL